MKKMTRHVLKTNYMFTMNNNDAREVTRIIINSKPNVLDTEDKPEMGTSSSFMLSLLSILL